MKKLITILLVSLFFSCSVYKLPSTEGLTHEGETIYYNGFPAAHLTAIELSWDNGRIVRELTFVLTSAEFNGIALNIIQFIREHNPDVEVELELKR